MAHMTSSRRLKFALLIVLLFYLFAANTSVKAQGCAWGDIICEMQEAIQQLLDPLKDWAMIKANALFYGTLYELIHHAARFLWGPWKGLYSLGVGVGSISEWIGGSLFQPMIQATNTMTQSMIGVIFFIALVVLGCTYVVSSIIRLRVVNPRSAILWLLGITLFFQIGPGLFSAMFDFRRALNTYMLAAANEALEGEDPFGQLAGDDPEKAGLHSMSAPCNNFTTYLPGAAGTTLNGIDIGLAHLRADGYDVLNGGTPCGVGTGPSTDLPRSWYEQDGYFDQMMAPATWEMPGLTAEETVVRMQAAVQVAFASITRLFNNLPLIFFGVLEQIISLCLVIAIGLTFVSFSIAALFAFFERTEPIAWAVLDQWFSLIVQMIVIGLLQAIILALYVSVAKQPNPSPLITLAVSLVGLFIYAILLWSAIKSILNAFNRLFDAIGRATGARVTPGDTAGMVGQAGMALATGGMSLVGSAAGGMYALSQGATWSQAAGTAFGNNRALDGAAWQLTRLPGVRNTVIGEVAEQFVEGAAAGRAGQALLGAAPGGGILGRLGGAALGTTFLTNRNKADEVAHIDEHGSAYWQAPLLNDRLSRRISALATNPTWAEGEEARVGRGGTRVEHEDGTPVRQRDIAASDRLNDENPTFTYIPNLVASQSNAVPTARTQPTNPTTTPISTAPEVIPANNTAYEAHLAERNSRFFRDADGQLYRQDGDNDQPTAVWRLAEREAISGSRFLLSGETVATDELHGEEHVRFQRSDGGYERQRWQLTDRLPTDAQPLAGIESQTHRVASYAADTDLDEQIRDDMRDVTVAGITPNTTATAESAPVRLEQAANTLAVVAATAGDRLTQAADAQVRATNAAAAQQSIVAAEGRMNITGANNVADFVGRILPAIQAQNAQTGQAGATPEQVSRALTGVARLSSTPSNSEQDRSLSRLTAFVDKAVAMGIGGSDAERVLREVKANPAGQITSETRHDLINQQRDTYSLQQSVENVSELERFARQVPEQLMLHAAPATSVQPNGNSVQASQITVQNTNVAEPANVQIAAIEDLWNRLEQAGHTRRERSG